ASIALDKENWATAAHYFQQKRLWKYICFGNLFPIPLAVGVLSQPNLSGIFSRRRKSEVVCDIDKRAIWASGFNCVPQAGLNGSVQVKLGLIHDKYTVFGNTQRLAN